MSAALTVTNPEQFEKTLLRVTLGTALGGLASGLLGLLGWAPPTLLLPLAAGLFAVAQGRGRVLMALAGLFTGTIAAVNAGHPVFYTATAGALAGIAMAWGRWLASARHDRRKPSVMTLVGAAGAGALALVLGDYTVSVFESQGLFNLVPALPAAAAKGAMSGFFFGLSAIALHVAPGMDSVETLHGEVERELTGELARLCNQAVDLYRKCREALSHGSSQTPAQSQLKRSLEEVTRRALELARRWHGVDLELGERAESDVEKRIQEVRTLFAQSSDPAAKKQLLAAEKALQEEMAQIKRIRAGRERVVARLHADLAILERTRFALLAIRSSDAHLKAAELSTLSDNLNNLGKELDVEAQAIDEALRQATSSTTYSSLPQPIVDVVSPSSTDEKNAEADKVPDIELTR
jgi:hypothetical protein